MIRFIRCTAIRSLSSTWSTSCRMDHVPGTGNASISAADNPRIHAEGTAAPAAKRSMAVAICDMLGVYDAHAGADSGLPIRVAPPGRGIGPVRPVHQLCRRERPHVPIHE